MVIRLLQAVRSGWWLCVLGEGESGPARACPVGESNPSYPSAPGHEQSMLTPADTWEQRELRRSYGPWLILVEGADSMTSTTCYK